MFLCFRALSSIWLQYYKTSCASFLKSTSFVSNTSHQQDVADAYHSPPGCPAWPWWASVACPSPPASARPAWSENCGGQSPALWKVCPAAVRNIHTPQINKVCACQRRPLQKISGRRTLMSSMLAFLSFSLKWGSFSRNSMTSLR